MTIILDMGGVLMQHNMPGCIEKFQTILGNEGMEKVLGMKPNAEGLPNSLMEQFECGLVSEEDFIQTILTHAQEGTTTQDIIDAWNTMHAGIPSYKIDIISRWKAQGHRLLLLSNNNALHWKDLHDHYDMTIFEQCFASHLIHSHKPNKKIYEAVQQYLQEQQYPAPYYFVDDLKANRETGATFGWKTYTSIEELDKDL